MPGIVKVVTVFAGVKVFLGPYRNCNHSACFPAPNKCFQQEQLSINFFPWWGCSSCVHKAANRDSQPLFLPLRPTARKAERHRRDPWLQPPAPRQCQLYFREALILKLCMVKASLPSFAFSNVKSKLLFCSLDLFLLASATKDTRSRLFLHQFYRCFETIMFLALSFAF